LLFAFSFSSQALASATENIVRPPVIDEVQAADFLSQPDTPDTRGGMAQARAFLSTGTLNVYDTPLRYSPSVGPEMTFGISYSQASANLAARPLLALPTRAYLPPETGQKAPEVIHLGPPKTREESKESNPPWMSTPFSNLGPGWSFNWVAYLTIDSGRNATVRVLGGGSELFRFHKDKEGEFYQHALSSHALLKLVEKNTFERILPDGSIERYDLVDGDGRVFMTRFTDSHGNVVQIKYDRNFRISSITDAIGQISTVTHVSDDSNDPGFFKIAGITDPFGRTCKFTFDAQRKCLQSSTDSIGLESSFKYEEKTPFMTSMVTPYGPTLFRRYKPKGSPQGSEGLTITNPNGGTSIFEHWAGSVRQTYAWDGEALKLYSSDPADGVHTHCRTWTWSYDAATGVQLPVLLRDKPPLDSEITYTYDGQTEKGFTGQSNEPVKVSRAVSVADEKGSESEAQQIYQYQYNSFGHVLKKVDPVGRIVTYRYATNDIDLLEIRQGDGPSAELMYKWEYNDRHLPTQFINGSGQRWTAEYNSFGQPRKSIDPKSITRVRTYDEKGCLISITGPSPATKPFLSFSYDRCGRVQTAKNGAGATISFSYDNADRPTVIVFPDKTSERFVYDRLNVVEFTYRNGGKTKQKFNSLNQLVSQIDPIGREVKLGWCDCCGLLLSTTDSKGQTTKFERDLQGRLITRINADKTTEHFAYGPTSTRLKSRIDALNQVTNFSYNLDNSLARVSYSNAVNATPGITLTYDRKYPRYSTLKNDLGEISFHYGERIREASDPPRTGAGLLDSVLQPAIANSTIKYKYDSLGRVINRTIGSQNSDSLEFDPLGFVISETNPLGKFKYDYSYSDNQPPDRILKLSSIHYPNGQTAKLGYFGDDQDGRVKEIFNRNSDSSTISRFRYDHDSAGNITDWQQQFDGNKSANFKLKYDEVGQLKDALLSVSQGKDRHYHFDYDLVENRILAEEGGVTTKASFGSCNQLLKTQVAGENHNLKYDLNGNLVSDGINKFEWDASCRLIKIVYPGKGNYTRLAYDVVGRLSVITEASEGHAQDSKHLLWADFELCEERNSDGSISKQFFPRGEIVNGTKYYYTTDHLGSIRELSDSSGNISARYLYDPFGNSERTSGDKTATFQYCRYFHHSRSGLSFSLTRAYSPSLGRWLNRDPILERGGMNLYAYVGNRPLALKDPTGMAYITWNGPHPQIVFEDGLSPSNTGFGNGGIAPNVDVSGYSPGPATAGAYNDALMRDAVNQVIAEGGWEPAYTAPNDPVSLILSPITLAAATIAGTGNPNAYHVNGNNCQDFLMTVLDRYDLLLANPNYSPGCVTN